MNKLLQKTIVNGLLVMCFANVTGQDKILLNPQMYVSPEGKLYAQKDLPIYLWISTSPEENSKKHRLHSERNKAYTNPMYLDAEGFNSFRTPSAVDTVTRQVVYPMQELFFDVYADSKPPTTSINYGHVLTVVKKDAVYCGGITGITLIARDETSGVNAIYYSIDGIPFIPYTDSIQLPVEKEYYLQYYAIDNVGNAEETKKVKIIVDDSNPATMLKIDGDSSENNVSGRSSIQLIASDNYGIKAVYYSIDNRPFKIYQYAISAVYLAEGEHSLKYYSEDLYGNKEVQKEYLFFVDKTPPTIVEEMLGKSFVANGKEYASGLTRLKLTTFDNKSGVKEVYYSINNEEFQLYTKPIVLSSNQGTLLIRSYAVDNVNNKSYGQEQSTRTSIPYVDLSGPELVQQYEGPVFTSNDTVFINSKTKLILKAKDLESGMSRIEYKVNDGTLIPYESPFSFDQEGLYRVDFYGYDNVENLNRNNFLVCVDNTGPEIYTRFSIEPKGKYSSDSTEYDIYPGHALLFLSATDKRVGLDKITYSLNNSTALVYSKYLGPFQTQGVQEMMIKAIDKLGNETSKGQSFGIMK